MLRLIVLVLTVSMSYGCATKIMAEYIIPAKSSDVMKYHTVAVTEFSGKSGHLYSSDLESFIANLKHKDKKLYNIIDRVNVKKIIDEQNFQMTIADDSTVVELGKLIGVEAIWAGFAADESEETSTREPRSRCSSYDKNGHCNFYTTYYVSCVNRSVRLDFTPKLIAVSTGKIVYSRKIAETETSYACSDSFSAGSRSSQEMIGRARNRAFETFRKDIAPTITRIEIEIKTDNDGLVDKPSKELFSNSIEFATNNRIERSCEIWREIIKNNKASIALNYNIGICLEVEGKVQEALNQMIYTDKLLIKPDELVTAAIKRGELNIQRMKELKEQLNQ